MKYELMGCPCYAVSERTFSSHIRKMLEAKVSGYTVAINAEKILKYRKDVKLRNIIDGSVFPYPDGAGAVLALKWLHGEEGSKINMPIRMLELAHELGSQTYILGAKPENHDRAIGVIQERYPNLDLVGHLNGYASDEVILDDIRRAQPEIILIAMGSPRQEYLAKDLLEAGVEALMIGCGGALDILAGHLKRAPEFMIENNLEWLYRLIQEPWRARRQLFLPVFFTALIGEVVRRKLIRK